MELIKNRYQQVTPTAVTTNGCAISVPIYLNMTADQSKAMLNAFRNLVAKQRLEMGWDDSPKSVGELSVQTQTTPPITPAEQEIGMNESSLRYAIFNRGGTPERLVLKLSELTGVYVTCRKEIEEIQKLWLDQFYNDERSKATTTRKRSNTTKRSSNSSKLTDELVPPVEG